MAARKRKRSMTDSSLTAKRANADALFSNARQWQQLCDNSSSSSSSSSSSEDDSAASRKGSLLPQDSLFAVATVPSESTSPQAIPQSSSRGRRKSQIVPGRTVDSDVQSAPPESRREETLAAVQGAKSLSRTAVEHVQHTSRAGGASMPSQEVATPNVTSLEQQSSINPPNLAQSPSQDDLFFIDVVGDSQDHHHDLADGPSTYNLSQATFQSPNPTPLLFPLSRSQTISPSTRITARGVIRPSQQTEPPVATKRTFTADPSKLLPGKRAKFYGVRKGRQPGVYYSWDDTRRQTGRCESVFQSFPAASDVEAYMNHEPKDCRFSSCSHICATTVDTNTNSANEDVSDTRSRCVCCSSTGSTWKPLRRRCFSDPGAWVDAVIEAQRLVPEQASILRSVAEGRNVFITGAAGTGKSKLIHAIKEYLQGLEAGLEMIAPTGIAAVNIGGQTMHSYAAWDQNVSRVTLQELCDRAHRKKIWKRFDATDVLVLDEVSMVESDALTRLSQMMQAAASSRGGDNAVRPFGGKQIIISGDFFQLPPVKPFEHCMICGQKMQRPQTGLRICEEHGEFDLDYKYAFASPVWTACDMKMAELKQIHRQADPVFISILTTLRKGQCLNGDEEKLLQYHPTDVKRSDATKLLPTKEAAGRINDFYIGQIPGAPTLVPTHDHFERQASHPELEEFTKRSGHASSPLRALQGHRYLDELELKCGMLVLLVANISKDLVNGSVGRIVRFVDVESENMPRASMAKKKSDPKAFDGRLIYGEHRHYQEEEISKFCDALPEESRKWPVVRFKGGVEQVIAASCSVFELGRTKPYSLLSRTQIPLLPGYAMTIHRCQGMTLDSVVVDLDKCWEPGQAYVASSRARSLKGLIVDTLPKRTIADPVVQQFMSQTFGDDEDDVEALH